MQTTNETKKVIHIKAELNGEFRRFSLDKTDFTHLLETIISVYSLPCDEKLRISFVDDEKDLVTISSDAELLYAVDLCQPLRLTVTKISEAVLHHTPEADDGQRGKWAQKPGWKNDKRWKDFHSPTNEEKIQSKITYLSERVLHVESLLASGELPAHRERTLTWKLEKLRDKLVYFKTLQTDPSARGRGRGGRGGRGRGGRGRGCGEWEGPKEVDPVAAHLRDCRKHLRIAQREGNQEEIAKCEEALQDAKSQKRAAKEGFCTAEKALKRECLMNLREARASGDKDRIEECACALIDAKEALQKAKLQSKSDL